MELVTSALLGTAANAAYDPLRRSTFVRSVFLFDKSCSKLADDLKLYAPFFDAAQAPVRRRETLDDFKKKLEDARSLLQECEQLKHRSGVFHPMQRYRLGKKIIRLRQEIREFMLDNRLLILGMSKLDALGSQIELRLAKPDEEDAELLSKIIGDMEKVREEMQKLSGETRENTAKIMDLMRTMNDDDLSENAAAGSSRYSTAPDPTQLKARNAPPLPSLVVGLDEHVQRLKRMLFLSCGDAISNKVTIVGGMGGIGKTTLALAVCHDRQVKDFFEQRIHFITVSQNPDMISLLSNIWTKVTGEDSKSLPHFQNLDDAYAQLCCELANRVSPSSKCLLVLDDVWSKKNLEKLTFNIPGLWTLLTTRQAQEVETPDTQTYEMECLDPKNARRLFCYWTFGQENIPSWADETLVEEVISECKGLPLALTVIGGSLSSAAKHNMEACIWRQTRDKLRQSEQQKGLMGRLRTSVDALDGQLRDCFMDLGAFPEDVENPADNVLDIWVYVRGMDWDAAYCALIELASRCLLNLTRTAQWDDLSDYGYGGSLRFSQHDVMRDMAIQLGRENLAVEQRSWLLMPQPQPRLPEEWQSPTSLAARIISISYSDYTASRDWPKLHFPNAEALLLYNVHNELPLFVKSMSQLKVLIVRCSEHER